MPDRTFALLAPLAQLYSLRMTPAVEAIMDRVAMDAALAAALVSRGLSPGLAPMAVQQWRALGLQVAPEVYAPAHLLEATLTGAAVPAVQMLAATQPWLLRSLIQAPGYEAMMGIAPRMEPWTPWMAPGISPGVAPRGLRHPWIE